MRIKSMLSPPLALSFLGLALIAGSSSLAMAQPADQPGQFGPRANKAGLQQTPAAELVATHGDWKVQCETVPKGGNASGDAEGQKSCGMVQTTKSEKNPKAGLTLVLVKTKAGDKTQVNMRVIAPIGVFLPTGVALEIDGEAVGRVPFTRCMPQICMAFAEASPETLVKMKKGNEANFIIYEAPGIGLPMKLSLNGFSAALAELDNF